ncbi:universal stress protein [Acetobacter fallax]|uniref:Universal stress protein n=1 Tax=Acetobacter fallax TaxID=1737473 RepID=A0ABX0KCZ1_9PROT|nr:universal stress protein [Acetobacter fallax]NHO34312.1 universal stress protein [Acetobacter fallax]NHO37881.1 universal stress protein [Acetobacter fallax]
MRILAILDRIETATYTLETACELAARLGHPLIRVLHPELQDNPDYQMPDEGMPSPEEEKRFAQKVSATADALRDIFQKWKAGLTGEHAAEWIEIAGDVRKTVAREAMNADITVLSRPRSSDPEEVTQAFSGALYDAGTTVVVAPLQHHGTVGRHPVIAWHPSSALDRAMAAAQPFLDRASHVSIVIGEDRENEVAEPPIAEELRKKGVTVSIDRFVIASSDVGEEIRQHALKAGGDLLVMGAYSRPHFIEWLFGGPTQDILSHATLPILTHH